MDVAGVRPLTNTVSRVGLERGICRVRLNVGYHPRLRVVSEADWEKLGESGCMVSILRSDACLEAKKSP